MSALEVDVTFNLDTILLTGDVSKAITLVSQEHHQRHRQFAVGPSLLGCAVALSGMHNEAAFGPHHEALLKHFYDKRAYTTLLLYALHYRAFKWLLTTANWSDKYLCDNVGYNLLKLVRHPHSIRFLAAHGVDMNKHLYYSEHPLYIHRHSPSLVQALLECGANVNAMFQKTVVALQDVRVNVAKLHLRAGVLFRVPVSTWTTGYTLARDENEARIWKVMRASGFHHILEDIRDRAVLDEAYRAGADVTWFPDFHPASIPDIDWNRPTMKRSTRQRTSLLRRAFVLTCAHLLH